MKKLLIIFSVLLAVTIGSVFWLQAAPSPIIGTTEATPTFTSVNTPTQITVTSAITDSSVIPNGVNLMRVNDSGKAVSVMGRLHDDGLAGDAVARDKIFTYRFAVNQSAPGLVAMQVSAAFKGVLRRSTSPFFVVAVSEDGILPPDPGNLGKMTLEGIDSDGNGIRDDVQRYIALHYSTSKKKRAALTQSAIANLDAIFNVGDDTKTADIAARQIAALDCMFYVFDILPASQASAELTDKIANTHDRRAAYLDFNDLLGGEMIALTPDSALKSKCTFNPDAMGD